MPDETLEHETRSDSLIEGAREALQSALRVAEAAFALLRAELRLARSSAVALLWLGFALVFFGAGAWLAVTAGIAVGVAQLTGSPLIGVAAVATLNLAGVAWVIVSMRRCWRDLGLPRTRALIARSHADIAVAGQATPGDPQARA